jgi:hypothetical protein
MVDLPEAIISLESWDESINMMIIAESGWGKTVLAGTADQRKQNGPKALFLATERGTISASRMGSTADVWPIQNWRDLQEGFAFLNNGGQREYQWCILDSITEMQKLSMNTALAIAHFKDESRDPDVPQIQDHLKVQNQTLNMLRRFNDLSINCLYTALPYRLDDANGNPYFLPAIDGKQGGLAQQAMGYMHVVGHGVKRTIKDKDDKAITIRRVYFQTMGPYRAKDRYDVLKTPGQGPFLDNPTIPQIEELINKNKAVATPIVIHEQPAGAESPVKQEETPAPTATQTATDVHDAEVVAPREIPAAAQAQAQTNNDPEEF